MEEADSAVFGPASPLPGPESEVAPGSSASNTKPAPITTHHPGFSHVVLNPRRIYIQKKGPIVPSAFAHFGTEKPQGGYKSLERLGGASIWVEKDSTELKRIAAEYTLMRRLDLSEEDFASLAKEIFLLRAWRSEEASVGRQWRADRMLRLACPPDEENWLPPPILDRDAAAAANDDDDDWSWDVRPDCAYWLSLAGFNPDYLFQVEACTFVRRTATCPYLTVEFERDGQSEDVAVNRVAAAGSLALYGRWRLHSEARAAAPAPPADDLPNVRHYALTCAGSRFTLWVLRPTARGGRWDGCTVTKLARADCADACQAARLADWINEIHRWGLSEHGPSCGRDIEAILGASGVRISDVYS
ncbi:hypothetical protein SAMD00023353_1502190 [Rosellinia necatrix]|uniref:Uncharacterized protein n=1 Tax=Rosellinia necatrix TaxID=77044 RepID=A0A1W2TRF6_ROSNE|nr:hypothetical protein SAMD00023353_1502190 [Rosellinia necatrix]